MIARLLRFVRPHGRYAALTLGFGVLGFVLSFVYPWIIGSVVDLLTVARLPTAARDARLAHLTELAAVTAVLHAAVVYGRGHFNVHLCDGVVSDLRKRLFDHLQTLSVRFFSKERTGAIAARVLYDVQEAPALLYVGLIVVGLDVLQLGIAAVLLAAISWRLTLACAALFPLYGIVFYAMNPRVREASERMRAHLGRIAGNLSEQLAGQPVIKTCTAEPRESLRFGRDVARHHELVIDQSHHGHVVAGAGEVLVHAGTTIVVGYGGWLALHGAITPGMMTRFLGYILLMFGPVRRFAELNVVYQSSASAMQRVFRVLSIQPAVTEVPGARLLPPERGHVRFDRVSFRYSDDGDESRARLEDDAAPEAGEAPLILHDVTLEARPGERVAIVGPSGAGKSTLVSLVPRLYDASGGSVSIDGLDVRDYALAALRSSIAVVAQDSFVFTGTIHDNIAYSRPSATREEVVLAARAAHAHDFIERLPHGYETRLGERGVNLSGGQRQRISIARALLRNPKVLILDEATSALDAESEALVAHALERAMDGRTCFVVAHRLSTVRRADKIFVLRDGTIAEVGTHEALLAQGGHYASLVRHQC